MVDHTYRLFFLALLLSVWFTSNAHAYKLPDTGQTTCYDASGNVIACPVPGQPLAQDGSYNFLPLSYTDNGNGAITDNNTDLIWQKQDDGTLRTWDQAIAYCTGLNLGSLSGWRLPNMLELTGIVNYGPPSPGPAIHAAFTGTKSSYYWSATPSSANPASAWGVYFDDGEVLLGDKGLARYVRCVFGAETQGPSFVYNPDGTVIDTTTGLISLPGVLATGTWQEAIASCEGLNYANISDWRLANIREIGFLASASFSCDPPMTFFSSTTDAATRSSAWGISCNAVNGGSIYYYDKGLPSFGFFCVRAGYPGLYKLNITKSGSGAGTVMSTPPGISCPDPLTSCYTWFPANMPVTLTAIPNQGPLILGPFVFGGWSPEVDCAYGQVNMDTAKACNATFSLCGTWDRARVQAATRDSINQTYIWAVNNEVIQVKASNKAEDVSFSLSINVTLMGGYDCNFVRVKGAYSVITGSVTIKSGASVIFDMIMIM